MKKFLVSFLIGFTAGVIDIIPMIIQKLNFYADISAFVQWIILGIIINYIEIGLKGALKGLIVSENVIIPVLIIVIQNGIFGIIPIIIMTAILGILVGFFSEKFVK